MDGNHTISWYDYQWYEIHGMHALVKSEIVLILVWQK